MKPTVKTMVDPNTKPEDLELNYGWMHFICKDPKDNLYHMLMFGELTFLPEYFKIRSSNDINDLAKKLYGTPCWKHLISNLHDNMDKEVERGAIKKSTGTVINPHTSTKEDLRKALVAEYKFLDKELDSMPTYEFDYI